MLKQGTQLAVLEQIRTGICYYINSVLRCGRMGNFNRDDKSKSRRDFGRRGFGRRSFDDHGGGRKMHKAVCSNCGKDCEVPFVPTGSKPVYCSECFKKIGGGADSRRFQGKSPRRPNFERRNESRPQKNEQLEVINRKLDKILEMLTVTPGKGEKETKAKPEGIKMIAQKKTKTPKKKTPVTKE